MANSANIQNLAYGYSSESTQQELSNPNEYQHDRDLDDLQKYLRPCVLDESSLSIGKVNTMREN